MATVVVTVCLSLLTLTAAFLAYRAFERKTGRG